MVLRELPLRFDPLAPEILDDPYPAYARLREAGPLCRMGPGSYGVTRHRDVAALLKDRRLGSEFPDAYHRASAGDGAAGGFFRRIVLYRDPPDHTRLRRLLGQAFSTRLVRDTEPRIGELVDDLLAPARDTGRFDAVTDLAFPLPVMVVCALMGLSAEDRDLIRPRAVDLGKAFAAVVPEKDRAAADAAVTWLREYLESVLAERARRPGDDLLSRMLAAEDDGATLSHAEIVDNAVFSFFAGFETTMNLLATGCAALLDHPGQLARLRADRTLLPSAVEEFLRYDAPIQGTARLIHEPVTVGERTLRPGRVLVLLLGSANRDGTVFRDPDRLDVGRDPNPQVSFGGGPHHCMGAVLARLEARVAFGKLLDTFATLESGGAAMRRTDSSFRAYGTVPVRVRAR